MRNKQTNNKYFEKQNIHRKSVKNLLRLGLKQLPVIQTCLLHLHSHFSPLSLAGSGPAPPTPRTYKGGKGRGWSRCIMGLILACVDLK